MILIYPSPFAPLPYATHSLLTGDRCAMVQDPTTSFNLQRAGVPLVAVTPRDYAVMHRTHTGPGGEILHAFPSFITSNLPADWDG